MMSSLSALLVTAYIRNLIKLSASFHDYYKSYYIANAWLELSLVKTNGNVRGYGFKDTVLSWSSTTSSNFSGSNRYFSARINTLSNYLGDVNTSDSTNTDTCNASTVATMWYEIAPGGCVPVILIQDNTGIANVYRDNWEWLITAISNNQLKPVQSSNSYPSITVYGTTWFTSLVTRVDSDLNFVAWRSASFNATQALAGQAQILSNTAGSDSLFTAGWSYILMIANTDPTLTGHYCLVGDVPLLTQYITIDAQWKYNNVTLDLKWVRKAWLPADFCYTAISN